MKYSNCVDALHMPLIHTAKDHLSGVPDIFQFNARLQWSTHDCKANYRHEKMLSFNPSRSAGCSSNCSMKCRHQNISRAEVFWVMRLQAGGNSTPPCIYHLLHQLLYHYIFEVSLMVMSKMTIWPDWCPRHTLLPENALTQKFRFWEGIQQS